MKIVVIQPSKNKAKKLDAIISGGKTISFGQKGYEDFTMHKDPLRKERYISRHRGMGEDWEDPLTAGFHSRWLLWNKPTLQESIDNMNRRFWKKGWHFILRL